jgi:hypothetical protein
MYYLSASPALMNIMYGYCRLHMISGKVRATLNAIGQVDQNLSVQGIMLHEFVHCLDVSRGENE